MCFPLYGKYCILLFNLQEVAENGADLTHLGQVHSPFLMSSSDLKDMWGGLWSFIRHQWSGDWSILDSTTPHIGTLDLKHHVLICGVHFPMLDTHVMAEQVNVKRNTIDILHAGAP